MLALFRDGQRLVALAVRLHSSHAVDRIDRCSWLKSRQALRQAHSKSRHQATMSSSASWRPKCMHPKCTYTVHTNESWLARFCCKECRIQYHAGMWNLAKEQNSAPDLETTKLKPTNHGLHCEHQGYYGFRALPIVLREQRRQQALDEARAMHRNVRELHRTAPY